GVTYGVAYAGFVGASLREEYTCYGLSVNLAARQMAAAAWGDVWLDAETAWRAAARFEIALVGRREFKGVDEAQPVFTLLERRDAKRAARTATPVGRVPELEALAAAVQPILDGKFGGVITVTGDAGIGKSRLVSD